jgi:hypothetical protein
VLLKPDDGQESPIAISLLDVELEDLLLALVGGRGEARDLLDFEAAQVGSRVLHNCS